METRTCWVALGGNLGDTQALFEQAICSLRDISATGTIRASSLYASAPMGANAGDVFGNAVVTFDTQLEPLAVLDVLQRIEDHCGRTRTIRWGPRTLDLDLLDLGGIRTSQPRLLLPHPGRWYRRFVLDPLVELDQQWCDPVWRLTSSQLRNRLLPDEQSPAPLIVVGGSQRIRDDISPCLDRALRVEWREPADFPRGLVIAVGPQDGLTCPHITLPGDISSEMLGATLKDAVAAAFSSPVRQGLLSGPA